MTPAFLDARACAATDTALFFSDTPHDIAAAKKVCSDCPARTDCLAWAVRYQEIGVWGATTDRERRKLVRTAQGRGVQLREHRKPGRRAA